MQDEKERRIIIGKKGKRSKKPFSDKPEDTEILSVPPGEEREAIIDLEQRGFRARVVED